MASFPLAFPPSFRLALPPMFRFAFPPTFPLAPVSALRSAGSFIAMGLALALGLTVPPSGHAFEIRRDEQIAVAADETIDDTLIALAQIIEIDGVITGDLLALGERIVIRGSVGGNVLTGARTVSIEGQVGGTVIGFGERVAVGNSEIARNLFGFGREVSTTEGAVVGGNAAVFGANAAVGGRVDTDLVGFAREIDVGGAVGGDLTAYAGTVRLLDAARIDGDVVAHVADEAELNVSPNASVGGTVTTEIREPGAEIGTERGAGSFIVGIVLRFAAALITGLIALWLVPPLRRVSLDTAGEIATAAAIGLVSLVAVPIIALLIAVTLIGLPVALLGLGLWLAGLYLAKIVLAALVGQKLFAATLREDRGDRFVLPFLVGLLLVFVVISIPLIGGVLNLVLTVTGLGMLVILLWGLLQRRADARA